jgi:hypothetical protein
MVRGSTDCDSEVEFVLEGGAFDGAAFGLWVSMPDDVPPLMLEYRKPRFIMGNDVQWDRQMLTYKGELLSSDLDGSVHGVYRLKSVESIS